MGGPHATLLPRTAEGCTANMIRREMKTGRLLNTAFAGVLRELCKFQSSVMFICVYILYVTFS